MRCDSSNVEIGALATWPQSGWSWKVVKRCPGPNCLISIVGCGCRSHCGGIDAWPPCPRVANGASQCSRHPRNSDVKFTRSLYMIMLRKYLLYLSIYLSIYVYVVVSEYALCIEICLYHPGQPWSTVHSPNQQAVLVVHRPTHSPPGAHTLTRATSCIAFSALWAFSSRPQAVAVGSGLACGIDDIGQSGSISVRLAFWFIFLWSWAFPTWGSFTVSSYNCY